MKIIIFLAATLALQLSSSWALRPIDDYRNIDRIRETIEEKLNADHMLLVSANQALGAKAESTSRGLTTKELLRWDGYQDQFQLQWNHDLALATVITGLHLHRGCSLDHYHGKRP